MEVNQRYQRVTERNSKRKAKQRKGHQSKYQDNTEVTSDKWKRNSKTAKGMHCNIRQPGPKVVNGHFSGRSSNTFVVSWTPFVDDRPHIPRLPQFIPSSIMSIGAGVLAGNFHTLAYGSLQNSTSSLVEVTSTLRFDAVNFLQNNRNHSVQFGSVWSPDQVGQPLA